MKRNGLAHAVGVLVALLSLVMASDLSAAPFYEGKTVRVTVGNSPGGGFDLWGRLVARHLGKHIPGKPTMVVENVLGAGGLIHVTQHYAGKPDGLTIGHFNGGFLMSQIFGQPGYDFDGQKFVFIGAANKEIHVFISSKKTGITSAEKWRNSPTPVLLAGVVPGSSIDNCNRAMAGILQYPTKLVTGFKGTADVLLAIDSGEVGSGVASWDSLKANRMKHLETGELNALVICTPNRIKELPNIPTLTELAKTDEQRRLIDLAILKPGQFARPFAFPPGTPNERVEIVRKAFQDMLKDKEFLAEVNKMKFTLDPCTADELQANLGVAAKMDAGTKAKLKDILFK